MLMPYLRYGAEVVEAPTEYRDYARQMVKDMSTSESGVFLFDQVITRVHSCCRGVGGNNG